MRIGLNISTATTSRAGVGNYAFQLAKHLPILAPDSKWVFFGGDGSLAANLSANNVQFVSGMRSGFSRLLWEQSSLPRLARKEGLDLLHGADFSRPIAYKQPTVNTIHDLSPFVDPAFFPLSKRMYKRVLIALAARGSQAIITVSEFSHVQLLAKFPSLEGRVFVIHNGVEIVNCHRISNAKDDRPFLLFVGTLETRKNLVRLIQAFRLMRQHYKLPHRLVLAGKPGHGWQAIEEAINENGVRDAIEVRGYVREEKLGDLYHAATAVIYPSLYEGFGLPILEGMAHGTPVACSNTTSLPEVGGNAVIYFNPHDVEEMAAAIERVLRSPSLQAELREKGLKRASQFTWEECARKHIEVYRKVLSQ